MEGYQAVILGLVQGLTEMLPISSSAHLNIIPWIFNWQNIPEWFDVALHFGTLLAIATYFFKDWIELIEGGYKFAVKKEKTVQGRMFWFIVIATIPGGIIGFLLDNFLGDSLNRPIVIASALILMGIVLYLIDKHSKNKTKYENMNLKQTFLIGVSQALAFIPGVSRSGITITTARSVGVERKAAAKFSFLLSSPIVLAATVFKMKDFVLNPECIIGIVISFLTGLLVIRFLLNYIQKKDYKIFAIYRIAVGLLIILIAIIKVNI